MWWWTKIRRADRAMFEGYGETMIAMVHWREAVLWLRERQDIHARREDRLETVEWAILIFVIVGVVADLAIVAHESGIWP